jgi:hypothetical protein
VRNQHKGDPEEYGSSGYEPDGSLSDIVDKQQSFAWKSRSNPDLQLSGPTPSFQVGDAWGQVKVVERRLISPGTEDIALSCQNFTKIWEEPI